MIGTRPLLHNKSQDKQALKFKDQNGKYCLDDMSIGFEEDTSNGEIKVTLYQEDHKALCNKMDVAIEGKTLVTETSPVIETRVVDSTLKCIADVMDTENITVAIESHKEEATWYCGSPSPYEHNTSTTPTPATKGETITKSTYGNQ
ncbi:hypothetical protein Tco_1262847 [Tanacetum coccineum]